MLHFDNPFDDYTSENAKQVLTDDQVWWLKHPSKRN